MAKDPMHRWVCVHETDYRSTWRMAVPGGWLYRHDFSTDESDGYNSVIAFVPDPKVAARANELAK